jgi:hypothetical protein
MSPQSKDWACYQDDFETPGISPRKASCRKHKRQMPNLRRNARGRPHNLQRLCLRVENLGFLASLTRFAVVATWSLAPSDSLPTSGFYLLTSVFPHARKGIPKCFSKARAWSSLPAVVTMVTFMPFSLSTFA